MSKEHYQLSCHKDTHNNGSQFIETAMLVHIHYV